MLYVGQTSKENLYIEDGQSLLVLGSSGSGKTNLGKLMIEQLPLDRGLIIFGDSGEKVYRDVVGKERSVKYYFGSEKVLRGLSLIKELIKGVKSGSIDVRENGKLNVVFDDLGLLMTRMLQKGEKSEFREMLSEVIREGKKVGIIFWVMTYRPVVFDLPVEVRREIENVLVMETYAGDFSEFRIDVNDHKFPKKKGEALYRFGDRVGFVKTYEYGFVRESMVEKHLIK